MQVYTANVGDSGYLIIRYENGNLQEYFKSEEQQHSFNFPFQVIKYHNLDRYKWGQSK